MLYNNPRGQTLFGVQLAFLILAWIFVSIRAYIKVKMLRKVLADDWWMFAALVLYTLYATISLSGVVNGGTGQHAMDSTLPELITGLQTWYFCEVVYAPLSIAVRTSVGILILRLATAKWHRTLIYIVLAAVWAITLAFFFLVIFQCTPVNYYWDQLKGVKGHCVGVDIIPKVGIALSVVSALCDFVFALLPIAMLWKTQLNKRTKFVVLVLLSMGFLAGVVSLVRLPYVQMISQSADFLYKTVDIGIWCIAEPSIGIIAGCITTFRPLFKRWHLGRDTTATPGSNERRTPSSGKLSSNSWPRVHSSVSQSVHKQTSLNTMSTAVGSSEDRLPLAEGPEEGTEMRGKVTTTCSAGTWRDVERQDVDVDGGQSGEDRIVRSAWWKKGTHY